MTAKKTSCYGCKFKSKSIFASTPKQALESAGFSPEVLTYPANSTLLSSTHNSDAIFSLRKGMIKLERTMPDGNRRITALLKSGDTVGLRAWKTGDYGFDAIALGEVELCRISHADLKRIRKYASSLDDTVVDRLCLEASQADLWLTHFSVGSVNQRFANLLLYLASHQGEGSNKMVRLLSREDMASILGVRHESISRAVTQFKADGLMVHHERGNYSLNLAALKLQARSK